MTDRQRIRNGRRVMTNWEIGQKLYRAEWVAHDRGGGTVCYDVYEVVKVTPKGGWIDRTVASPVCGPETVGNWTVIENFSTHSGKYHPKSWRPFETRCASTTKEEALSHLRARARSHLKHSRRRWEQVNRKVHALYEGLEFCPCAKCFTPIDQDLFSVRSRKRSMTLGWSEV